MVLSETHTSYGKNHIKVMESSEMHFSDEVMRLIVTGALSHSILVALTSKTLRRVVAQFGPMQTSWSVLNHPRTLDWARVLDIPEVSWTNPSCSGCSQLARHGLLEAVKWARANGWPWSRVHSSHL